MFETGTASDYLDLLEKIDTFLTATGSAFGLQFSGAGNGTLTAYKGGASSIAETFEIEATDATTFSVTGSISGSIGTATAGSAFSHAKLSFLISSGSTPFVAGDLFTLSTAPAWTRLRLAKGCKVTSSNYGSGAYCAENLIDGKWTYQQQQSWHVSPSDGEEWVEFEFLEAETIVEWRLMLGMDTPTRATLEYWTGSAWSVLDDRQAITGSAGEWKTYTIASPHSATKLRVTFTSPYTNGDVAMAAVEFRRAAGGFAASVGQRIWKAPGNDGNSEIFVGIHHLRRLDVDYYDLELASFDGFDSAASFHQQVGAESRMYLPLWDQAIDYWLVADGRRLVIVAKIGSQYEFGFFGFPYDPFFSPDQLPYPAALGGSLALGDPNVSNEVGWENAAFRWSGSTNRHRAAPFSDLSYPDFYGGELKKAQLRVRRLDGVWIPFEATTADAAYPSAGSTRNVIWPYIAGLSALDLNRDGGYSLLPIMLCGAGPNSFGQLSGIVAITGQGLSAESLIRRGSIDYLALPNISRSHLDDWFAVALD